MAELQCLSLYKIYGDVDPDFLSRRKNEAHPTEPPRPNNHATVVSSVSFDVMSEAGRLVGTIAPKAIAGCLSDVLGPQSQ